MIPTSPDHITPDWLTAALSRSTLLERDEAVNSCSLEQIGVDQGFMSAVYRVTFDTPSKDRQTIVIKIGNAIGGSMVQPYRTELYFYKKALTTDVGFRVPAFYHGEVSEDGLEMVLALEYLDAPYICGDQVVGDTYEQARQSMIALAGFHRATWHCHPSFRPEGKETVIDGKVGGFKEQSLLTTLSSVAVTTWESASGKVEEGLDLAVPSSHGFPARSSKDVQSVMTSVASCIQKSQPSNLAGPTCLVHGDYRSDNLMHAPGIAPCVLDFQVMHYGNPMEDVAQYVAGSLTIDIRREHLDDLLQLYHDTLVSQGVTGYTFEEATADFRREALYFGTMAILLGSRYSRLCDTETGKRSLEFSRVVLQRTSAMLADLELSQLMTQLSENCVEQERPYPELSEEMGARVEMYKMIPAPDYSTVTVGAIRDRMASAVNFYRTKKIWASVHDIKEGTLGNSSWRVFMPSGDSAQFTSVVQWAPDSWISGDLGYNEINIRTFVKVVKLPVAVINTRSVTDASLCDLVEDQRALFDALSAGKLECLPKVKDVHLLGYGQGGHTAVQLAPQVEAASLTLVSPFLKSNASSDSIVACGDRYECFTGVSQIKWTWNVALKNDVLEEINAVAGAAEKVSSFPRTLVVFGEFDPLRSESEELISVLESGSVAGYMAPGCTFSFLDTMYEAGHVALERIAAHLNPASLE